MRGAAAFVLAAVFPACVLAADPPPGRAKAQPCSVCHGALGISTQPDAPNLAGQPGAYLVEQLKAFRSGKRPSEVMNIMAKPLTDDDVAVLADWYSAISIEAKEKP
jgi:cytochrome c553